MAYLGTKPANAVVTSEQIADGVVTPNDLSPGKPVWDPNGNLASTGAYVRINAESTTNGANSGFRLLARDSAGNVGAGGTYLSKGTTAATTFIGLSADDANYHLKAFNSGQVELPYGQLKFPATQSASSDANTLDDYEEGTWTPTLDSGANSYGFQVGRYVKVGKSVTLTCSLNVGSRTASGNTFRVNGLPFISETSSSNYFAVTCFPVLGFNRASATSYIGQIGPNSTSIFLYGVVSSTGQNYLPMSMNDTGAAIEMELSVTYITS